MRKIVCLFLALVACLLLATVASAEEVTATVPTTCEACGGAEVEWVALPSGNTWRTLDAGHYHYYLTKKETTYRYTPNPSGTINNSNSGNPVTICLDLNGFAYETNGRAMGLYGGCTLNIMDSSAENTGYVKGTSGDNNTVGGTFFAYGTLNVYDVTLKYANDGTGTNQTYSGGVISLGSSYTNATLNMYGGRLEGGKMVSHSKTRGATVYAGKGNINLYNTEVISGSLPEGKNGPCIYLDGAVNLKLSGSANVEHIYVNSSSAKINVEGTYSGKTRIFYDKAIALSEGKVIGTGTNTPKITGDLFCTNGDGWLVNVDGSNVELATFTPSGEWHHCEHCNEVRRWTKLTSSNNQTPYNTAGEYHYYVSTTTSLSKQVRTGTGSSLCLDLYGSTLSTTGRGLLASGTSTINLMDTKDSGVLHAKGGTNNGSGLAVWATGSTTINMYGGTVRYTNSTEKDNRYGVVIVEGIFNMYGGTIEGADLATLHASSHAGAIYVDDSGKLNLYGGTVTSGQVGKQAPCVEVKTNTAAVKLAGDAEVDNIYFTSNSKNLTVSGDYTGTASVTFKTAPDLGAEVGVAAEDAKISGRISCTNGDWLVDVEGDTLVLTIDAPAVVVDGDTETGYETLQAAITGCESGYVMLLQSVTEDVTVDKDIILDLNGQSINGTVTVSQGATLYGMDSKTDDYTVADEVYGQLTFTGPGTVVGAEGYLAISQEDKMSFHRYTVQITNMTLRSEKAGIYYKSAFQGDEVVAGIVESFGVAMNVKEIPDETNMNRTSKYSTFTNFQAGATGNASTSTLLKNILKTDNSNNKNKSNMNVKVYGRPYLKTADGYIFGEACSRSLTEQLYGVDEQFTELTKEQRYAVMNLYETYHTVLKDLELPNMAQQKTTDEKTLSLLMVGNSFCYYYVEELYGLLMANPDTNRGYENVEIYNVYSSGCKLNEHYNWWVAGNAKYDVYKTDANGRVAQTPSTGTKWTLEEALVQGNWDYISLQGMSSEVSYASSTTEENIAQMTPYAAPLLAHFHQLFPKAQLLWHRTWPFEVGRISGSTTYTEDLLAKYNEGMQNVCDYMCEEFDKDKPYDLKIVNSGAAWVIAREENAKLETSLIPVEGGLCARLSTRNETTYPYYPDNANAGDGYHDGDIGGGQFLNACAWYETLTGQSVLDNPYKPTTTKGEFEVSGKYELSDEFADLLRNAAHNAVNPTEE